MTGPQPGVGSPIIQTPVLRPTDVVREPGLDPQTEQTSQIARLLMAKGQLALENEKFQASQQQLKQHKQVLDQLNTTLSGLFQGATPEDMPGRMGQAAGALGGAGETGGAAAAIRDIPGLMQQQQAARTRQALGGLFNQFVQGDVRDPGHQAEFLYHALVQGGPEFGKQAADAIKPLQTSVGYNVVPGVGLVAVNRSSIKLNPDGTFATPPQTKLLVAEPPKPGALTQQKRNDIGGIALQFYSNMHHALLQDPDAIKEPTTAAGAENIAKSNALTAIMGGAGALGIGPGTPAAAAQQARSPMRAVYLQNQMGFAHTYLTWLGGTPRSNVLLQSVLKAIDPGAGAPDAAYKAAAQQLDQMGKAIMDSRAGRPVNHETLPFFKEVQAIESVADQGSATAPQVPAQPPLSPQDLLGKEEE